MRLGVLLERKPKSYVSLCVRVKVQGCVFDEFDIGKYFLILHATNVGTGMGHHLNICINSVLFFFSTKLFSSF